ASRISSPARRSRPCVGKTDTARGVTGRTRSVSRGAAIWRTGSKPTESSPGSRGPAAGAAVWSWLCGWASGSAAEAEGCGSNPTVWAAPAVLRLQCRAEGNAHPPCPAGVLEMAPRRPETPGVAEVRLPTMGHYARATLTVVLVLALLAAAWRVRNILLLVVIALVLAVGLDPAVRRLQRLKVPRGWAVLIIFLATIGFLALFGALVIPPLVREIKQLASDIPGYVNRLKSS